ncbi:MAG: SDR family NAD(P)-dependent oxidoreductase [bacterium]|nr:SDR family NAD(P)-dependent oxidoreductase [bacterium]
MRILVTGGAGFIGSNLVDRLVEKKEEVFIVDDLSSGDERNINKNSKFFKCDISDKESLKKVFKEVKPEIIFHLAAQIDVRISTEEPERDAKINIIGTINILDLMKEVNSKKIIFSSSGGAIYGEVDKPVGENYEKNPESCYGISKYAGEYYIKFFSKNYGYDYTILRYGNVYGERQSVKGEAGVVAIFINRIIKNLECTLYGYGKMYRDYVYVQDIVEANVLSLEKGKNKIYNVGTGKSKSVLEVFESIRKHFPSYSLEPKFEDKRKGEIVKSLLDSSLIRKDYDLDFTDFDEGIEKTVKYFKENLNNG